MAQIDSIPASADKNYKEGVADVTTQYVSKIIQSGETRYIKDALARQAIANIEAAIAGGTHFIGVTTTELTDGSTTNPVTISGQSVTAKTGDFVIMAHSGGASEPYLEFIWTGSSWTELGSTGQLKALAYKDSASASYTPEGTVADIAYTPAGSVKIDTYTPAGTVADIAYTPAGSVKVNSYTPAGTVADITYTPEGSVTDIVYEPAGTINTPDIIADLITETKSYLESATYSSADESLTLSIATAAFATGASSKLADNISFTGTTATLSTTFSGEAATLSTTFSGTTATDVAGTFSGTAATLSTTFSGTTATDIAGTFSGTAATLSTTFSGTTATITVS